MRPNPDTYLRFLEDPTTVSIGASSAANGSKLDPGLYYITSDVDCFFKQGQSGVAATSSSIPLWANDYVPINITDRDGFIAVIQDSAAGTLHIIRAFQ